MSVPRPIHSLVATHRGGRQGSVLILVLWVSLGLVALALTFGHSMMMTYRGADNDLAGRQADQAIEAAVEYAKMLMQNVSKPGELPDPAEYTSEAVPVGEATFWFLGASIDDDDGTTPVYGLVDEASKLNLNRATRGMLIALPEMTDEFADAIVDWHDADQNVSPNGAESETYMLRQPPYAAKDANFESVEELALVNGANPFMLFREDANLNGVLDPNEDDGNQSAPEDDANGRLDPGILRYVTAFSRESTKKADGTTPRVNVAKTATTPVSTQVQDLLTSKLPSRKDDIVALLNNQPIQSVLEFYIRGQVKTDEQELIDGEITDSTDEYVLGRVNVNTASEAVLACIPGIGPDRAASVVAARKNRAQTGTSIDWFAKAVGDTAAIQAGRWITGKSYQVSVDVAAVGRHGRGYRRTRFIVDMSTGSPVVIYRRNLGPLGWSLGSDVKQTLAERKNTR